MYGMSCTDSFRRLTDLSQHSKTIQYYNYTQYHRRRNRGGHGGHGPPRFQKMNFGPHSFGEVRGIVFSDLYGWKMQKCMQNYCY